MNKQLKILLYFFSALIGLSIIYASYELILDRNTSLFDNVKTFDMRNKGVENQRVLVSNITYANEGIYIEKWEVKTCTSQIYEEKYMLPQISEIWFCKSTGEAHQLKDCTLDIKDNTLCFFNEKEFYTCKEGWLVVTK
jgi:hypothetical protein